MMRDKRQKQILRWAIETFGPIADVSEERGRRFLEEAIELAQCLGVTRSEAGALADRVFERPPGDSAREIGQVGLCLLAAAEHLGISAECEEYREVQRVQCISTDEWRARHDAKAAAGLALFTNAEP